MKRIFSLCLLVLGTFLLIVGLGNADSIGSELHRLFTVPPPDKAMWFLIGGVICSTLGGAGLFARKETATHRRLTPAFKNRNPS